MKRFQAFAFLTVLLLSANASALTSSFSDTCATLSLTGPSIDPGSPYYIEASGRNNLGSFHNASLYIDEHYSGYSSSSVFDPSFTQNFGTFTGAHTFKLTILCGPIHDLNWRFVELTVARKDLKKMAADICTAIKDLPGGAFKNNPEQRKNAFCNKTDEVIRLIESAEASTEPTAKKQYYQEAIDKLLNDIGAKMDGYLVGGDPKDDWITNEATQLDLYPRVQQLVGELVNLL